MAKSLSVLMLPDNRQANPYQALLAESLEKQGVKVRFPQGYRRGLPLFREVVLARQQYELVHLHWILPYVKGKKQWIKAFYAIKFLLDIALIKLFGVKVVWTIHNRVNHESAFPQLEWWVRRNVARLADRIILHNQATLELIAQEYQFSPQKASVILHGHYRDVYHPSIDTFLARKELGLPLDGQIFLNLGLLRPYKGIEALLNVWIEHQEKFNGHTLLIAGKASEAYATTLRQRIKDSGVNGIILIPEFIEDNRIHLFFSAASIVVLPYQNILNSGSLILAMSYGLPIIAPKLGSIPEYLGFANELLYEPDDDFGLLNAMKTSLHIEHHQLTRSVIEACDRLDWVSVGKDTFKLYSCLTYH
jgi:glycosyltransferase involved in cell wall biosynthesis